MSEFVGKPGPSELMVDEEIAERERRLVSLFESGLDSPDIMAYHGTSLEALQELIKTGNLPTGKTEGGIGYLYFFRLDMPVPENFLFGETEEESSEGGAKMYAESLAYEASLCRILGLDIRNEREFLEAMDHILFQYQSRAVTGRSTTLTEGHLLNGSQYDDILSKYLDEYGFPCIKAAFDESIKRKGVIIGINQKILNHDPQSAYEDLDDEGWRVNLPEGLPLEYISGLEPVGQPEYEVFEKMQEKFETT